LVANEIAYNGVPDGVDGAEAGVRIHGSSALANSLGANSIHDNDGPGILLADGGNNLLAAPTITQASCQGPISGTACANCTVDIFSDSADEGRVFEGTITANAGGTFSWNDKPNGPNVTATATQPAGHTSSFSTSFSVGTCNSAPVAAFTISPAPGAVNSPIRFDASGSNDTEDPVGDLQVRWDFDNDGIFDTTWSTAKVATNSYTSVGAYIVRLEVQDTMGMIDAVTKQVDVASTASSQVIYLPMVLR
jgi:PKD repeat protein